MADGLGELAQGSEALSLGLLGKHCKKTKSSVSVKEPQVRGKSALLFFRDDFLASQRHIMEGSASVVNPCSKEFWTELKRAWADMPAARRAYYTELSDQSLRKAAEDREARKQRQLEVPPQGSASSEVSCAAAESSLVEAGAGLSPLSLPASVTEQSVAVPYNPWTLAAAASTCANIPEIGEGIQKYFDKASGSSNDLELADPCLSCSPVSEDQLQSNWQSNLQKGKTWAEALNHFNMQSQRFSVPPASDKFPERVTYQSCCGCFCRTNSSPEDLVLFGRLLASFEDVIKCCGGGTAPSASMCDILLRFSFFSEEAEFPLRESYAWMTAMTARSGPHPCTQNFILMSVVQDSSLDCLKLRLDSKAAIQHELKWCSALLNSGPLHHFSEQEFAKHLLESLQECHATAIVITRLSFKDLDLCTVVVEGSWDAWDDLIVRAPGQQVVGEGAGDVPPTVADDAAIPASSDGLGSDSEILGQSETGKPFDLLAEVSEGGEVRKSGKGKGRGRGTSSELRRGLVAALPFDPAVQKDMEDEFQQFLTDEQVLLPDKPDISELEKTLRDPTVAASLDEDASQSILEAVAACRESVPDPGAVFEESDDGEIIEDNVDADQEEPAEPSEDVNLGAAGIGSVFSDNDADDGGAADDVTVVASYEFMYCQLLTCCFLFGPVPGYQPLNSELVKKLSAIGYGAIYRLYSHRLSVVCSLVYPSYHRTMSSRVISYQIFRSIPYVLFFYLSTISHSRCMHFSINPQVRPSTGLDSSGEVPCAP